MHPVRCGAAVKDDAFRHAKMIEIRGAPCLRQLAQNVPGGGPVFKALKVVVEPMADIFVPFSHHDPTIGLGQNDCTDQTCGTGPDDFNRFVFRVGGTWR